MTQLLPRIDLHVHTAYSDGTCSVEEAVQAAGLRKIELLAIADHYNETQSLPRRLTKGGLKSYLNALETADVLKGVEVEIFWDGEVSISKDTAKLLDFVIGGVHNLDGRYSWDEDKPVLNETLFVENLRVALIKAMETGLIDVIAHATWLPEVIRAEAKLIDEKWIRSVVEAASTNEVAIELNSTWKVPDENFVRECIRQGVKLSIGSDAHIKSMVGEIGYPLQVLKVVGATKENLYVPRLPFSHQENQKAL